jgi:putative ABC transport system permease protein
VYIPLAYLPQTSLIQEGSMVTYRIYMKLPKETDPDQLLAALQPRLNAHRLEGDTVQKRAASVGKIMDNLTRFLHLTGFIALLLGGIGVASAIHVYISEKVATVALLRCLGARMSRTFAIYAVQAATLGLGGSLLGAFIGIGIQQVFPRLLQDFLPVRIETAVSWSALGQSLVVGLGIVLLFTALPLLAIRQVSPLQALRSSYEEQSQPRYDPLHWLIVCLLLLSIVTFAILHTERWTYGLWFCVALGGAFLALATVAKLLILLTRVYVPSSWPYVWRQGLANLHRPRNQTLMLILALGLGAFLLLTLQFIQQTLIRQVSRGKDAQQSNLILFDIQTDQREAVHRLVRSFSLPIPQEAPMVTMRLSAVKGKSVEELRNNPQQEAADWALQHEYRATYRRRLIDTETLIAGTWRGEMTNDSAAPMISLEEEVARALGATVGDDLVFDVQGVPMTTTIASIRKVDWQQIKPNFFVVFPPGVLEAAPQTHLLVTRTPSSAVSAAVQRAVVQQFPNVSALDLTSVLHTLDTLLGRIAFAIRFMALFSIAAGVLVLVNAVLTSRQQRIQESVLLRALGASRGQIRQILFAEYFFLGSFAVMSGATLAVIASWGLSRWIFEAAFTVDIIPLVVAIVVVLGLTVLTGALGNRSVVNRPPLEVLRGEG